MENKHNNTQGNGNSANTHNRGFASMPHEKVQEIASKGGHTTTENTHNRGFGSMPHEKVQEIASKGGHASHGSHSSASQGGKNEEMAERERAGGHASGSKRG